MELLLRHRASHHVAVAARLRPVATRGSLTLALLPTPRSKNEQLLHCACKDSACQDCGNGQALLHTPKPRSRRARDVSDTGHSGRSVASGYGSSASVSRPRRHATGDDSLEDRASSWLAEGFCNNFDSLCFVAACKLCFSVSSSQRSVAREPSVQCCLSCFGYTRLTLAFTTPWT